MSNFTIEVDDAALKAVLQRIANLDQGPLNAILQDIGEGVMARTKQRFVTSTAPDGTPWLPLSQTTYEILANRLGKSKGNVLKNGRLNSKGAASIANKKILIGESKRLSSQIVVQSGNGSVTIGSTMIYAAMQQFGGKTSPNSMIPNVMIPARPFLPITKDGQLYPQERTTILQELNALLEAQIFAK
jgi:phage virion morphogenesis protein